MNERIKELAEQATQKFSRFGERDSWEKLFAELIVGECVNVLDKAQWDKGEDWVCADGTRIIPKIEEHFGVE